MNRGWFELTGVELRGKNTGITYTARVSEGGGKKVTIGADNPRNDIFARLDYEVFCKVLDEMTVLKAEVEKLDAEVGGDE